MNDQRADVILKFWFGDLKSFADYPEEKAKQWFLKDDVFDQFIRDQFEEDMIYAADGDYDDWANTSRGALALILLLDQFPRNAYRGTPQAFATDHKARELAQDLIQSPHHHIYKLIERVFVYLPLEHAEDLVCQNQCVSLFEKLVQDSPYQFDMRAREFLDYAQKHRNVIDRFGRFPHRNVILNRPSTVEEFEFLQGPDSQF